MSCYGLDRNNLACSSRDFSKQKRKCASLCPFILNSFVKGAAADQSALRVVHEMHL